MARAVTQHLSGVAAGEPNVVTDRRDIDQGEAGPMGLAATSTRGRLGLSPLGVDVAVAVGVFGASVVNVAAQDEAGISAIPTAGFFLLAGGSVALLWRRRRPLVVLGTVLALTLIWTVLGYPGNPVFHILAALYAVGRYVADRNTSVVALVVALALIGLVQAADDDPISEIVTALIVTALPWYVGLRIRVRREQAALERERAEQLELMRATEAQRVIADARAGIARELHDVVAHNVSVMTVQAGVARLVVTDDPERAEEALSAVEAAGRRALDELRHLLGVLRPESASDELAPQPGLAQLHQLVDQLRQTGMPISLSVEIRSDLPARIDLFAFRIVQEALTNVLKHGGVDAATDVRLEETDGHLDLEVTNTGTAKSPEPGSGQGIVGMQERANLLGGSLEAGPRPTGGFRVWARLPIGDQ